MARLHNGEKARKLGRLRQLLRSHGFGLYEGEAAGELGWERRTTNNYLRELMRRELAYKEGHTWHADD